MVRSLVKIRLPRFGAEAPAFLAPEQAAFDEESHNLYPILIEIFFAQFPPAPGSVEALENRAPWTVLSGNQQRSRLAPAAQARIAVLDQDGSSRLDAVNGIGPEHAGESFTEAPVYLRVLVQPHHDMVDTRS